MCASYHKPADAAFVDFFNKLNDRKVPELKHTVVVILINKIHTLPLYVNYQLGTEHAPVKTDELACTLFKPYDIFKLAAVIVPLVVMLAHVRAPVFDIDALVVPP